MDGGAPGLSIPFSAWLANVVSYLFRSIHIMCHKYLIKVNIDGLNILPTNVLLNFLLKIPFKRSNA